MNYPLHSVVKRVSHAGIRIWRAHGKAEARAESPEAPNTPIFRRLNRTDSPIRIRDGLVHQKSSTGSSSMGRSGISS